MAYGTLRRWERRRSITVRDGKGRKDRVTMLPTSCREDLLRHLEQVRRLHDDDLARGLGRAPLPYALARKYLNADKEWGWQYVFPLRPTTWIEKHRHTAPAPPP